MGEKAVAGDQAGSRADSQTGEGEDNLVEEGWGRLRGFLKKSTEKASELAETGIEKVKGIDGKKLVQQGKGLTGEGLDVIRGNSGNETVDQVSDGVSKWVPGAAIFRNGAEALKESGVEAKVLGDGGGQIQAEPFFRAGERAIPNLIPVPGLGVVGNQIIENTGIKQKAARTIVEMTDKNKGVIASDNNPQLGNITIIDPAKQEEAKTGLDTAKDKLRGFLRGLSGEKK